MYLYCSIISRNYFTVSVSSENGNVRKISSVSSENQNKLQRPLNKGFMHLLTASCFTLLCFGPSLLFFAMNEVTCNVSFGFLKNYTNDSKSLTSIMAKHVSGSENRAISANDVLQCDCRKCFVMYQGKYTLNIKNRCPTLFVLYKIHILMNDCTQLHSCRYQ